MTFNYILEQLQTQCSWSENIKPEALARIFGVSHTTIYRWYKMESLSEIVIKRISDRTQIDFLKEFYGEEKKATPNAMEAKVCNLNDIIAQKEHTIAVLTKELDTVKLTCTKLEDTCAVKDERINALEQQCKMFSRIILTLQDLLDKQ